MTHAARGLALVSLAAMVGCASSTGGPVNNKPDAAGQGVSAGDFPAKQCMPLNGVCCVDADGDGRGVGDGCVGPDCDDTNNKIFPGNPEVCDGIDNDCNGMVDDNPSDCGKASCTLGAFGYFE